MLIDFSVTNFRSILERQSLSMAASSYFKEFESVNTFAPTDDGSLPRLVKSAVLYGPNASGKSTLINALKFVKQQVMGSQKESQAGDEIDVTPFKLTAASRAADSEFEVAFVEDGVRYEYGFRCNRTRFTEEWLFAYPLGRAQKWFHRVFDADAGKDAYKFAPSFLGGRQRQSWSEQTRSNALFLSTAIQLNNTQLTPAFNWFKLRLRVITSASTLNPNFTTSQCKQDAARTRVVAFMNAADLSIADIVRTERPFTADELPKDMPAEIKADILKDLGVKTIARIKFLHKDSDTDTLIAFDEKEESDGTQALFAFAGPWLDVVDNERVLVVDELDTSLHPLVVRHLVQRLHHANGKAQLIFSTHDTSLLSPKLLRRDQIWFVEKDSTSASRLYPLSDFSPRDGEAIERGYLNGRYGGIPFLKDLSFNGI
jgi:AAA15 family ATPase/GTPase